MLEHTGIAEEDYITGHFPLLSDFRYTPGWYVAFDRQRDAIVLGLRGSTTHKDWLTDLCATSDEFLVRNMVMG